MSSEERIPDALCVAFALAEESAEIVKVLVVGQRTNGSFFVADTGLDSSEVESMFRDFRAWRGEKLAQEMMGNSSAN